MLTAESSGAGAPRRRRTVTIARIAEAAGVSVPTVSKVINGRSDVAAHTRQRVQAALQEYGYQRREKVGISAPLIELVFHELTSLWAMEIIHGVEDVARNAGLSVVLSELEGRFTPREGWIETVLAHRPTGVICVLSDLGAEQRRQLDNRGIPLVVIDPAGEPGQDTPWIGATNWSGGLAATRHLVELGHRRIAVITGPEHVLCSRARLDGYRAAMDAAGLTCDPALIRHGDFHVEAGFAQAQSLLALPTPPTAIFAGSDLQAVGVYEAARQAGLRIPGHLSVVGFDDLPVARWIGPPLTTVRQPLTEMAAVATRLVLSLARGEQPPETRLELATSLVVRGSTGPADRRA